MSRRSDRFRRGLEDKAFEMASQAVEAKPQPARGGLIERRIEWVTWGISVMILGVTIVVGGQKPFAGTNDALYFIFPALSGGLMLISAVLQKIIKNWNVSIITWALGTLLTSVAIERFLALFIVLDRHFNFVYFIGAVVIITGLLILLQIFRRA